MKPILLKLSGLQSYRSSQEIDFETLCETGLFGIFGPTGSGKSTLLDAITLAMYGKVERAVNGTQGIMNHSEDSLSVSFTFDLSSAAGQERYRVERKFKRVNELSVSNTISRFIQVTPEGDQVMADKLADVTRCVEEKIGLKMDDFTRAVVLPQGKFAEFLSLKGSERRQMLQRLFHLERYGDQLAIKLSRRVKDTDSSLKSVEAEQQGLGHAGVEALDEATRALEEAKKHAMSSRDQLQAAMEAHEALGKIRELDLEKRRLQGKLDELALHEEEMKQLERRLELTGAAAAVLPALEAWRESGKAWDLRRRTAEDLTGQSASAQKAAELAYKADEAAQVALRAEEPKLVLREQQLEQAVVLQRERNVLREELARLDMQRVEAGKELEGVTAQLQKEQELLERGRKRQEDLQNKLKGLEIRSSERQRLHMAMQKVQALEANRKQKHKVESEEQSQVIRVKEQEDKLGHYRKQEEELQRQYIQLSSQAGRLQLDVADALAFADRIAAASARLQELMNQSLREKQLHALSLSLAAELREGEPCPVCGSEHHPLPAAGSGQSTKTLDDQMVQFTHQIQEARLTLRGQHTEAEALVGQLRSQMEPYAGDEQLDINKDERVQEQGWQEAAISTVTAEYHLEDVDKLASDTSWLMKAAESQAAALAHCRKEASSFQQSLLICQQEMMKQKASLENSQLQQNQLRNQLAGLEEEAADILNSWQEGKPEFLLEEAAARFQLMQEKDAESESIKEGLERSVPFIEEKKQAVQRLEQRLNELEKQLIQWDAQREGKADGLKDKEERLQAWIGDRSAEELLAECRAKMAELKESAEQARIHCRQAEEAAQRAAKEAALAEQAERTSQEQHQAARLAWESQLADSPFASENAVMEACLTPAESERCVRLVEKHREGQREWTLRLRDVEEKLGTHPYQEEDWNRSSARLQAVRLADEEALQARARAERDLEDLRKRHIRFMELEERRFTLQRESERLSKLQSCLRGNAFVEYIAEEQLMQVSQSASQRLRYLTKQRYSLEVDSGGGFVIRDDANGGVRRPVSTLSGGETFLTSLALALALSAQIQLRGQYPLQFFFLDEGFGTLDPELLETVITALERLHNDKLTVGIISHVPELRSRLPRKLIVRPAEEAGAGSQLEVESM
ncbi:chromosome segregation protein SMC [Bacillus sp. FJAT-18019]|nr:chromosome segregation protein SMC [Bacillus sp. FJAT-18019]